MHYHHFKLCETENIPSSSQKAPTMQDAQEAIEEAFELFIKYTRISEPTQEGRIARLEQQLRDVASGSWQFSDGFNAWRDTQK